MNDLLLDEFFVSNCLSSRKEILTIGVYNSGGRTVGKTKLTNIDNLIDTYLARYIISGILNTILKPVTPKAHFSLSM